MAVRDQNTKITSTWELQLSVPAWLNFVVRSSRTGRVSSDHTDFWQNTKGFRTLHRRTIRACGNQVGHVPYFRGGTISFFGGNHGNFSLGIYGTLNGAGVSAAGPGGTAHYNFILTKLFKDGQGPELFFPRVSTDLLGPWVSWEGASRGKPLGQRRVYPFFNKSFQHTDRNRQTKSGISNSV